MSIPLSSSHAFLSLSFFLALSCQFCEAQTITVAAAADLTAAEPALSAAFEKTNPNLKVRFVTGASTALAQQIKNGAPYDVFLSANVELVDQLGLEAARNYATGHVAALWRDGKPHDLKDLLQPDVKFVALANPQLAPYGLAARKALEKAGLWEKVQGKVVYAENVRQALQLFDSGNADVALTAASLLIDRHSQWVEGGTVAQRGGIVRGRPETKAAVRFMDWLVSKEGQAVLAKFGFDRP